MENFSTSKSKLKIIFIFLIICLIFLVFAVFMSFGLVNRESVTSMSGLTNVGKDMPKINAKSFEEETVVLDPKSNTIIDYAKNIINMFINYAKYEHENPKTLSLLITAGRLSSS